VTNPLFLRLWKNVLLGASKLTRIYVSARERTTQQLWEEMDTSGALENFNYFSVENFTWEGAFSHSKGNLPTSDQGAFHTDKNLFCVCAFPLYSLQTVIPLINLTNIASFRLLLELWRSPLRVAALL